MDHTQPTGSDSELFVIRLWGGEGGGISTESGQGKIQHIKSGKAGAFRDWQALIEFMVGMMHETGSPDEENGTRPSI